MNDVVRSSIIGFLLPTVILTFATFLIWAERKLLALLQDRHGPNRIGPMGLFQMIPDAIKLFFKEDWIPPFADKVLFVIAPAILMITTIFSFAVVVFSSTVVVMKLNIGILYFLCLSSLGVYSIVIGGWSSNNTYSLYGAVRGVGQMFAYEVFMGLSMMGVVMLAGSFDLSTIVASQKNRWNIVPQFFGFIAFFLSSFIETRRPPFDLAEAENELVAGYHTEYSGMKFGMFLTGEYIAIALNCSFITMLFLGGSHFFFLGESVWWFIGKTVLLVALIIMLRWTLPRPRYDQLIRFGWVTMLPLVLLNLVITAMVLLSLNT